MRIVSLSGCLLCQELGSFMYALASALYIMLLKVIMCMQRHKSRRQIKRKQEGMSTREERSLRQTEGTIQPCLRWKGKGFHRSFFFFFVTRDARKISFSLPTETGLKNVGLAKSFWNDRYLLSFTLLQRRGRNLLSLTMWPSTEALCIGQSKTT